MSKDWKYSKEYEEATLAEKQVLEALSDILFDVQYANTGSRAAARRDAALTILRVIKEAYALHKATQL